MNKYIHEIVYASNDQMKKMIIPWKCEEFYYTAPEVGEFKG